MVGQLKLRLQFLEMPCMALPVEFQESSNTRQKTYSVFRGRGGGNVTFMVCYNSLVKDWLVIIGSIHTSGSGGA